MSGEEQGPTNPPPASPVPAKPGEGAEGSAESEPARVYLRFRRVFGDPATRSRDARRRSARSGSLSQPFGSGRDPKGLADVILGVTTELGWNSTLAQSDLMEAWPGMVGDELSDHSTPVGIEDGTLTVQCDSTAWATQLRLMRVQITTSIVERYPEAGIQSIRFLAPNAPSWKSGPQIGSRAGPSRYLRLTRVNRSPDR